MPFGSLWLPVIAATVAVFAASSILHMVVRHHKADYRGLTDEDDARAVLRKSVPGPGYYVIPHCADPSQMKDPAVARKYTDGPVAILAVLPNGMPNMGKFLGQWFVFCLLATFTTGYVARHTLAPGADPMSVLRITGTLAFAIYGIGPLPDSIWKGVPWSNTARGLVDALVYATVTGLVFRLLWPA